jgi:4-hydroxymandelate oxidase
MSRRQLLRFVAASPLAVMGTPPSDLLSAAQGAAGTQAVRPDGRDELITRIQDALDVFDFEAVARRALPPAHFGYLATGTDDDATLRANRDAFGRYQLRVRRLVNVAAPDMSVKLFGASYDSPIVLAPVSSQRAFHPEGELAVAKAAGAKKHLQILSTLSSTAVEAVNAARGEPVWFQLYPTNDWAVTKAVVARAESAACPVLVLTVDTYGGSNRVTQARLTRRDDRTCQSCHTITPSSARHFITRPMFSGIDMTRVVRTTPNDWSWDFVARLRELTRMKIVVKGIVTREDAELARARGVDGIIVSNHGGRAEDSGRGAIECLREVVEGAGGAMPVLVDSGFRRGTDIFKALALGATAICIGRPYLWGLAAFGQPGVEQVLTILRRELELAMRQAGTASRAQIDANYIIDRGRW